MKFNTGIYQIINLITNKRYIGSAVNLRSRKNEHYTKLKAQIHHSKHLQNSHNKYGKENFKFEILLYCSKENLLFYEQRVINSYDLKKELYNKRFNAENNFRVKYTEEARKNMSIAKTGQKLSEETKEKLRQINIGKKLSAEHKHKLFLSNLGRKCLEETRIKISTANKGHKLSEEHKQKLKEARRHYKYTEETREKMSKRMSGIKNPMYGKPGTNKGKKFSAEHKQRISQSQKGKIVSEETRKRISLSKQGHKSPRRKPIKVFRYKTNEFIGKYESIKECSRILNINYQNVSKVLNKKQKHHKKYIFEYINSEDKIK